MTSVKDRLAAVSEAGGAMENAAKEKEFQRRCAAIQWADKEVRKLISEIKKTGSEITFGQLFANTVDSFEAISGTLVAAVCFLFSFFFGCSDKELFLMERRKSAASSHTRVLSSSLGPTTTLWSSSSRILSKILHFRHANQSSVHHRVPAPRLTASASRSTRATTSAARARRPCTPRRGSTSREWCCIKTASAARSARRSCRRETMR